MAEYSESARTPLFDVDARYRINNRGQVIRVLRNLAKRPDIITAWFDEGRAYLLTAVLDILPERGLVVLDYGANDAVNRKVLDAEHLVCVTRHDNIDVRFSVTDIQRARFRGGFAFAGPIPAHVYRLQRREYFRVRTPVANPVRCTLRGPSGDLRLPLADIGGGGLCLLDESGAFPYQPGERIERCTLALPDIGVVFVDIEVRHLRASEVNGRTITRIGCRFLDLTMDKAALVQRYVNALQVAARTVDE